MAKKTKKAKPPEETRAIGRPREYQDKYADQARKLCLMGATDKALADFFEVDERTIYRWRHDFPEFCQALEDGKVMADAEIASSLYHRAKGYSHPEDKFFQYEGTIIVQATTKHYPPDTAAAIIWLKNRKPALWRDKPDSGEGDEPPAPVKIEISVKDARREPDAIA